MEKKVVESKKTDLKQELDKTQKEVKSLRREINNLRKRWSIIDKIASIVLPIIWVFIAWTVSGYVIGYCALWILGRAKFSETFWTSVVQLLTYIATIAIVFLVPKLFIKSYKTTKKETGATGLPTFTDIGIAILGFVLTVVVATIIISILNSLHITDAAEKQNISYHNLTLGIERVIAYISIAIIAPIAEELLFRGWLYSKLRKKLKLIPAIVLVSIFFGFLHGQLATGIYVGILSTVMCLEKELTGTIHASILTHILQNSFAFILLILQGRL